MLTRTDYMYKKIVVVYVKNGEKMSFRNDNLIVKDKDGKVKHQSTCYRLFAVYVVGHFTITTGLLQRAKKYGFAIILLTSSFRVYEMIAAPAEGNTLLRRRQYLEGDEALEKARHFVVNKIDNQIRVIKKARQTSKLADEAVERLHELREKALVSQTGKSLLGIEGSAAHCYFQQIFVEYKWKGRKPRVKHDINNCLLDVGYTLLFAMMETLLNCYGFDLYVGFYHQIFYMRKSLVCDLVEPFRCIIDHQIRRMNGLRMIDEDDFVVIQGRYQLSYEKSSRYVGHLLKAILEYKEEMFLYVQRFYRAYMKDKPITDYPVFIFE